MDASGTFIDVSVGCLGSMHDTRVFKNSKLFEKIERGEILTQLTRRIGGIPVPPLLLGDAAYPLSKTLLKPHPENALAVAAERRFSTLQCRTRVKVEQSCGELQGRWRCLSKRLDESPQKAAKTFIACCVLHNICVDMGDRLDNPPIVRGPTAVPPPPPPSPFPWKRRRETSS